jgi:hypothetical protein
MKLSRQPHLVLFSLFIFCFLLSSPAPSQTSYPMITYTTPVAVQRGKTTEVTVHGSMDFSGIYKVLFDQPGIRAEILPGVVTPVAKGRSAMKASNAAVKIRMSVAADANLGVREFRLASSVGLSSTGQLLVVDDPVIQEKGVNNTPDHANLITVPCVVCGRIETPEDVDCYRFRAEKGKSYAFEVVCARLEDKIHDLQKHADPLLRLLDAQGRELALDDDCYFSDPVLTFTPSVTGQYYLEIRDSKYDGDARWVYAILATDRPYVAGVYPIAGNPGQELEVEPVSIAGSRRHPVPMRAPKMPGLQEVQLKVDGVSTNPVPFIVSPLPQVVEIEPNDEPGQATRIPIPCGINGRIDKPRDVDHYRFTATKSKPIRFEVRARRLGSVLRSTLDSVLDVLTDKGKVLASNDDTYGKDAALVFMPPADGDYILRIRDLNHKGSHRAVYFIEADFARPDFTLRCDPDKAMIGPGSSTSWYVQVTRVNGFIGPIRVEVEGLPKGVAASDLMIAPSMTQGVLVLTAGATAPREAVNVRVVGRVIGSPSVGGELSVPHVATPNEEIYFPGGGRGIIAVNEQSVAVTEPSDIQKVEVSPQKIDLEPGKEVRLNIKLKRRADFDKPVSLDVLMRHLGGVFGNPLPPGVSVVDKKSKTLLGKGSDGYVTLMAKADAAPIENVPISVQAYVSINFVVKMGYSSPPVLLSIRSHR